MDRDAQPAIHAAWRGEDLSHIDKEAAASKLTDNAYKAHIKFRNSATVSPARYTGFWSEDPSTPSTAEGTGRANIVLNMDESLDNMVR